MAGSIVIVGAGRQGRNIAEIFERTGGVASVAGFLDDTKPLGFAVMDYPVLRDFSAMHDRAFVRDHSWIVSLGDNQVRGEWCAILVKAEASFVNAVHPSAQVSRAAIIGRGVYLGAFTNIGPNTLVDDWVIIDAHCHLGVDVAVHNTSFVGPGSILTGGCSVGPRSFVGAASTIANAVTVGADCVVGANSLVLRSVGDGNCVAGTPARPAELNRRPLLR